MSPITFPEANVIFNRPEEMTDEECGSLPAFVGVTMDDKPIIISCWEVTDADLVLISKTRKIWAWHYGVSLQPHAITSVGPELDDETDNSSPSDQESPGETDTTTNSSSPIPGDTTAD